MGFTKRDSPYPGVPGVAVARDPKSALKSNSRQANLTFLEHGSSVANLRVLASGILRKLTQLP